MSKENYFLSLYSFILRHPPRLLSLEYHELIVDNLFLQNLRVRASVQKILNRVSFSFRNLVYSQFTPNSKLSVKLLQLQ